MRMIRLLKRSRLEDTNYDYRKHDEIYATYQKSKGSGFLSSISGRNFRTGDTIVRFKEFKPYETEKKVSLASEYIKELKNPSSFKKAFILSEILNRKF